MYDKCSVYRLFIKMLCLIFEVICFILVVAMLTVLVIIHVKLK